MSEIFTKSLAYLLLIIGGYCLKKTKVLQSKDFHTLSTISINLTLPCVLISIFESFYISIDWIYCILLGLVMNIILISAGYFFTRKRSRNTQALFMLNSSSFNIGGFVLPFFNGIYPATSIFYASMFDVGNAIMCTGLTYACAASRLDTSSKFQFKDFFKRIFSSVPFVTYVIMISLTMLDVHLPQGVYQVADIIGSANIVIIMIMLGLMVELKIDKEDFNDVILHGVIRYSILIICALLIYYFFPAPLIGKQILILSIFSPISSIMPAFSAKLNCKTSVYAAINSLSMPISIIILSTLMTLWN
ncbi:MAG: AEC family transporter [Anaerorhabdus sp.]